MENYVFYDLSNNENYYLKQLFILEDGRFEINGETFDFEELKRRIESKQIRTSLPQDTRFSISGVGYKFLVDEEAWTLVKENEFLKEIQDRLKRLKGEANSADLCAEAFKNFLLDDKNEELRQKLEESYYAVPAHHRAFILGDMDSKDYPLRWAIDKTIPKDKQTIDYYLYEYFGRFE